MQLRRPRWIRKQRGKSAETDPVLVDSRMGEGGCFSEATEGGSIAIHIGGECRRSSHPTGLLKCLPSRCNKSICCRQPVVWFHVVIAQITKLS